MTIIAASNENALPHGAKGLDLGAAVLAMARDKFVLASKTERRHFTLHLGTSSQVLDIHQTTTAADGSTEHTTLFTIPSARLAEMVQAIAPQMLKELEGTVRPLRPGWMAKTRIGAVLGLIPTESELPLVTKVRRRKLVIDEEKLRAQVRVPEFLDDLYELQDGRFFALVSYKVPRTPKLVGIGFKITDATGRRRLFWAKTRRMNQALGRVDSLLRDAMAKYGTFHGSLRGSP